MIRTIHNNPEFLFLLSVLFYWFSTSIILNPLAIVLFVIGIIMSLKTSRPLAVMIGFFFLMLNAYLILALISEFREFPELDGDALLMLGVGGAYIAFNFYVGIRLIITNIPDQGNPGRIA